MRGIVAALVLLLATGCASVDGPDTYKDTAEAPACTAAVAKSMDVRKLISQADRLLGACVRVRGLADGQYLYADRAQSISSRAMRQACRPMAALWVSREMATTPGEGQA